MPIASRCPAGVVDLAGARDDRRLRDMESRLRGVGDTNRRALSRLFQSGVIFTRAGARLGRDLLLAHQHLLRTRDLLARVAELGATGVTADTHALDGEITALLARANELSARSEGLLARDR